MVSGWPGYGNYRRNNYRGVRKLYVVFEKILASSRCEDWSVRLGVGLFYVEGHAAIGRLLSGHNIVQLNVLRLKLSLQGRIVLDR